MYNKVFIFMFILHIVLFVYRGCTSNTYAEQEELLQEVQAELESIIGEEASLLLQQEVSYYIGNIST